MNENHKWIGDLLKFFPWGLSQVLEKIPPKAMGEVGTLRIRNNGCLSITIGSENFYLLSCGELTKNPSLSFICDSDVCDKIIDSITYHTKKLYRSKLCQGYFTLPGGYRFGICGEIFLDTNGEENIRNITSICIRIPRQITGCGEDIYKRILNKNHISNTLIAAPPGMGKTTIIRDLARIISLKSNVCIVDERSEIACNNPNGSLISGAGLIDILSGLKKTEAISLMVRSMSPEVLMVDEFFLISEASELINCVASGVSIVATVHGGSIGDLYKKSAVKLLLDAGCIDKIVIIGKDGMPGKVKTITDVLKGVK